MMLRVFVAGATGTVGLPLVRALCTLGHQVIGMTRAGRALLKSLPGDTRLRREGGANLLSAAQAASVRRYIIQSRGFYLDALEGELADETSDLRYDAPGEVEVRVAS